ncbi:hypothetical protein KP79_PYT23508 [Mizuhopecten yessoensis]|uniref:Uncharacterized protein n=1 Tax=Mizuhopecten yessoensis TaxID=6573 RepID=A0A210QMT4_MIZYE|nr:hypothetical protein KP79_PYT23508 [Mizuhopecten yessoensis]
MHHDLRTLRPGHLLHGTPTQVATTVVVARYALRFGVYVCVCVRIVLGLRTRATQEIYYCTFDKSDQGLSAKMDFSAVILCRQRHQFHS